MSSDKPAPKAALQPTQRFKGGQAPNETDGFRRAQAEGRTVDELLRDAAAATPTKAGLPTTWKDRDSGVSVRGNNMPIVRPDRQQVEAFSAPNQTVCGQCRSFNIEKGREEIIKQRFAERLVKEQEWKMHHMGAPPDSIGLCDQSGGELATTVVSKSCPHFRPRGRRR